MSWCWNRNPKNRPRFIEIIEVLLSDANPRFEDMSFYFKMKSQMLKQKSSQTSLQNEDEEASTLLTNSHDNGNVNVFPMSRTVPLNECDGMPDSPIEEEDEDDINNIDEFSPRYALNDTRHQVRLNPIEKHINRQNKNENNRQQVNQNSVQSSESSKGSKISNTTSNGSIANGHVYRTTTC